MEVKRLQRCRYRKNGGEVLRTTFVVTETYTIEATTIQEAEAAVRSDNFSVDNNLQNHKIIIEPNN